MYDELFYKRLIQLRSEKKTSARDMSLTIGQNAGYINNLENRGGLPSMTTFFYICDYLGVTPSEFFNDKAENPIVIRQIIEDLQALDQEQLNNIASIIKGLRR